MRLRTRLLGLLDNLAHRLYTPTCSRWAEPVRWHHHIHLIPALALDRICNFYDRHLGVTDDEMRRTA